VPLQPGHTVDRFTLIEPLGEGGQAEVWKASDALRPGMPCALKLLWLNPAKPTEAERVRREARALARLDHPSLVSCHALFEDLSRGLVGLALDLVEGPSLTRALDDARFSLVHRVSVLRHVAGALGYLHAQGVVHRDLKPSNVLLAAGFFDAPGDPAHVKLVDFGIATTAGNSQRLTRTGHVIGTAPFMAPEVMDPRLSIGGEAQPVNDVFAFGVLAWQLLVGGHPTGLQSGATYPDFVRAYRSAIETPAPWPRAALAGSWTQLLRGCLAIRAAQRLQDGSAIVARFPADLPVAVPPEPETRAYGPGAAAPHPSELVTSRDQPELVTSRNQSELVTVRAPSPLIASPPSPPAVTPMAAPFAPPYLAPAPPAPPPRSRSSLPLLAAFAVIGAALVAGVAWLVHGGPAPNRQTKTQVRSFGGDAGPARNRAAAAPATTRAAPVQRGCPADCIGGIECAAHRKRCASDRKCVTRVDMASHAWRLRVIGFKPETPSLRGDKFCVDPPAGGAPWCFTTEQALGKGGVTSSFTVTGHDLETGLHATISREGRQIDEANPLAFPLGYTSGFLCEGGPFGDSQHTFVHHVVDRLIIFLDDPRAPRP
jgi:eukaryotic-like serine/threonine-protein kinase